MSLDDVVQLTISTSTIFPTRAGFGVPLFLVLHSVTPNLVDEYANPAEMTDAGWAITSPGYLGAQKIFSQKPRPAKVVIGKRTRAYTQIVRLYPVKTTQGFHYRFTVVDPAGVETAIDYEVPGAATVNSIATALVALLDPVTDVEATDGTGHVVLTATAGKLFNLKALPKPADMKVKDASANPGSGGIAADLADIVAEDSSSWYGVLADHTPEPVAIALAAAVEAMRKVFLANTSDSEILDQAVDTDLASDLKAAAYARTGLLFSATELQPYSAHAWLGKVLPTDPGRTTWAYHTLSGVTVDGFTSAQITQLKAKRCNWYSVLGGINVTQEGISPAGEYLDTVHFVDWLYARMQERVFGTIQAASARGEKVPYTDDGVDTIRNDVTAQLDEGIKVGGLAKDPAPEVSAPKVADVDASVRATRLLPDITFSAWLAGAIHRVQITGTLSV
jgi:hypothetical protein